MEKTKSKAKYNTDTITMCLSNRTL